MKAVQINAYGGNEVIQHVEIERPAPGVGEVLLKVHAAGVNPVDWKIREGAGQRLGMTLPIVLGGEVAGTVEALGEGVTNLRAGDAVSGLVKTGGFAEYAVAKAADVVPKPATLDFVDAAAVPLGALTAWQSIFDLAGLTDGQTLLITNTSGSVGSLAVQLAKDRGAHVTAVASGRNAEFVRGLGADVFVDREKQAFEEVTRDVNVVFDTAASAALLPVDGYLRVLFQPFDHALLDALGRPLAVHEDGDVIATASLTAWEIIEMAGFCAFFALLRCHGTTGDDRRVARCAGLQVLRGVEN